MSVADVDQSIANFVAAGGALHMPAMGVPGEPGHGGWHELHTDDWKAALA